ncbi:Ctr copper transporter [Russula vinacea]|nr:Ctr copper transporter [Russula vinacea]
MDQGASMNMGNMLMYLHFKIGDNLWILGWAPSNGGAMAGACIALFMLAIAERWLVAMRGLMEDHWCTRAQIALSNKLNGGASVASTSTSLEGRANPSSGDSAEPRLGWLQRHVPPFILAHEIPRGISQVAITSIQFLFMLTVMTFQAGFILSIVAGLGFGEALFGRYNLQIGHLR